MSFCLLCVKQVKFSNSILSQNFLRRVPNHQYVVKYFRYHGQSISTKPIKNTCSQLNEFRKLFIKFWYVIVPVHLVTSAAWLFGFYCAVKTNIVDTEKLLIKLKMPQEKVDKIKTSGLEHLAFTVVLMKLSSTIRLSVTLTLTTICIKLLKSYGMLGKIQSKKDQIVQKAKKRVRRKRKCSRKE